MIWREAGRLAYDDSEKGEGSLLTISFYGVRGSTPCSSPDLHRYGGNTSCVVLEAENDDPIVFDLGTGMRPWGADFQSDEPFTGTALLTHLHWDHVQGLPFFAPIHRPGSSLDIYGPCTDEKCLSEAFDTFLNPPFFPVHCSELIGDVRFHDMVNDDFTIGSAQVKCRPVPHVGLTNGYRVEWGGRSVAYMSDHQEPVGKPTEVADSVLELADGVDVLIHDAQFTEAEFAERSHFGHCSIRYALEVAHQAKAKQLVLFHHDPMHNDDMIDQLLAEAQEIAKGLDVGSVVAASEGLKLTLD